MRERVAVLSLVLTILSARASNPSQDTVRVAGVLVASAAADAKPLAELRVLLIAARAVDLTGREIQRLPPRGTFIVDAPRDKPASVVKSDGDGKFSFEGVADGRYVLGMLPSAEGAYVASDVRLLEGKHSNPEMFDVKGGQAVDLGRVNPPALR
jgi:hypothetical protein